MSILIERAIIFAAGAVVSGLTTFFVTKKVMQDKCDKQLEKEMAEYRKLKEKDPEEVKTETKKEEEKILSPESYSSPKVQNQQQEREIFRRSARPKTDYTSYSKNKKTVTDEEHNHSVGEALTRELRENQDKPPELILPVDYMSEPGWSGQSLLFYAGDKTLTINDDQDEEIVKDFDEYKAMVGTVLGEINFAGNDYDGPITVYIRNYARQTDYEVTRLSGVYKE